MLPLDSNSCSQHVPCHHLAFVLLCAAHPPANPNRLARKRGAVLQNSLYLTLCFIECLARREPKQNRIMESLFIYITQLGLNIFQKECGSTILQQADDLDDSSRGQVSPGLDEIRRDCKGGTKEGERGGEECEQTNYSSAFAHTTELSSATCKKTRYSVTCFPFVFAQVKSPVNRQHNFLDISFPSRTGVSYSPPIAQSVARQ